MQFLTKINDKEITKFLDSAYRKLKDLTPLMKTARVFMKKLIDDNFETQGEATGAKWQEWSDGWKKRRIKMGKGSGKILNLDGFLRKSFTAKSNNNSAIVGTNNKYAAIHNFGFKGTVNKKSKKGKAFKTKLTMPKREFMRINDTYKDELFAELFIKSEEMLLKLQEKSLKNG